MNWIKIWQRLRRRQRFEQDLHDELAFHHAARTEALIAQGLTPAQAARQARMELGMLESHKDAVRQASGLAWFDRAIELSRDCFRSLARQASLTVAAILILSLTMAINLIVLSIYRSYQNSAPEMVRRGEVFEVQQSRFDRSSTAFSDQEFEFIDNTLKATSKAVFRTKQVRMTFAGISAASNAGVVARTAYGLVINENYFAHFAGKAALGRTLQAFDDQLQAKPTIVLSDHGWRTLAQSDPMIVGKSMRFAGVDFTVVGVMPAGFVDLQALPPQFWISQSAYRMWRAAYSGNDFTLQNEVLVRFADPNQAQVLQHRLQALVWNLPGLDDKAQQQRRVQLVARTSLWAGEDRETFSVAAFPIFVLALLVLLVACANLANLMLARGLARRRELAVRASIGASRGRLAAQLALESACLALLAAALGSAICVFGADWVHRYAFSLMLEVGMQPIAVGVDGVVLAYAILLAGLSCLVFGVLPALALTGKNLANSVKLDAGLGQGQFSLGRLRAWLMVLQVSVSCVLLVVTAIIVAITIKAQRLDLGFEASGLIDLNHPAPDAALRLAIERLPGVRATSAVSNTPLYGSARRRDAIVGQHSLAINYHQVDERYFATLGVKLSAGRNFSRSEAHQQAAVAVISKTTATRLWPGQNPLGQKIKLIAATVSSEQPGVAAEQLEVIGVVDNVVSGLIFQAETDAVYVPGELGQSAMANILIALPPTLVPTTLRALNQLCQQHHASAPCEPIALSALAGRQHLIFSVASGLAMALGVSALMICAIGLYGVVRFNLISKTREISLRMAVGGTAHAMWRLLINDALKHVRSGVLLGLPLCLLFSLLLRTAFGSAAFSLLAYSSALLALLLMAVVTASIPARAVLKVRALDALRAD